MIIYVRRIANKKFKELWVLNNEALKIIANERSKGNVNGDLINNEHKKIHINISEIAGERFSEKVKAPNRRKSEKCGEN